VGAFRSDTGASRQVPAAARARRFNLLLSVPLMLEYESVVLDEFHQHPVGTKPAGLRQAANLRCDIYRKAEALTYYFVCRPHSISMHQNGVIVRAADSPWCAGHLCDLSCSLTKQVLSQLSYTPTVGAIFILTPFPGFQNPFPRILFNTVLPLLQDHRLLKQTAPRQPSFQSN
jgi:hypothetical protein